MKKNKFMKIFTAILLAFSVILLTACGSDDDGGNAEGTTDGEKVKISLLIRDRGDLSYWDSMADGGDRAAEDFADSADINIIEATDDITAHLDAMYAEIEAGADIIITGGDFKDNINQVSEEYPDARFIVIGEDMSDNPSVYSVDFRTSEASFLSGIAAADISSQGLEGTSGAKTIGFIGGRDETLVVQEFLMGYIQGAKYYDEDVKVLSNYVGDFNDPDTARTQALTQFNDAQADVILAAAGGSGNGVHTAAAETGKYVIGVDSNQRLLYEDDEELSSRFATSVLKEIGNAIYNSIDQYIETGELPFGEYSPLGLDEEAVSIVIDDQYEVLVSEEGKQMIEEAREAIINGEIEVEGALGKSQTEIKDFISENAQ